MRQLISRDCKVRQVLQENIAGGANSKCKGPEVGQCVNMLKNIKEVIVIGAEGQGAGGKAS